jgi:hypothetical protein
MRRVTIARLQQSGINPHILDDDDPRERVRILSRSNRWRRLCLQASATLGTSPLTVRIDLAPGRRSGSDGR